METPPNQSKPAGEPYYDCIVISDLHLGSDVCQAKLLEEFLIWAVQHCHELVINGDIFDDLNFKRLTKRHFACLKVIRRNSDRDDFRLVWVRGNHDGPADIISHIVGVEILDEYVYDNRQIQLLILHGDQFDTFTTAYPWFTEIACGIFYYHPEVHAAPRGPLDPPDLEAMAAEQPARREPGHRIRPRPGLPLSSPAATPISRWSPSATACATSTAGPGPTTLPAPSWRSGGAKSDWKDGRWPSPRPPRSPETTEEPEPRSQFRAAAPLPAMG